MYSNQKSSCLIENQDWNMNFDIGGWCIYWCILVHIICEATTGQRALLVKATKLKRRLGIGILSGPFELRCSSILWDATLCNWLLLLCSRIIMQQKLLFMQINLIIQSRDTDFRCGCFTLLRCHCTFHFWLEMTILVWWWARLLSDPGSET